MRFLLSIVSLSTLLKAIEGQYPAVRNCTTLQPRSCRGGPIKDAGGKFIFTEYQEDCTGIVCNTPAPAADWFCRGDVINYPARLADGTGLPIGKAEDNYAACLFNNWDFALLRDNCRDIQLWSCDDCRAAYRSWLCSELFSRCQNGSPYQRLKTCREDCFRVVQRCPATQQFTCPATDPRDYVEGFGTPTCNNVFSNLTA